jgi:MoxR-like ATPase
VSATKDAVVASADTAAQKVQEGAQAVEQKVDEVKAAADTQSKDAAQAAIDKSREVADASHDKVLAGLDKAEAHVQDDRSFLQQAKDSVVGVVQGVTHAILGGSSTAVVTPDSEAKPEENVVVASPSV